MNCASLLNLTLTVSTLQFFSLKNKRREPQTLEINPAASTLSAVVLKYRCTATEWKGQQEPEEQMSSSGR